MKNHLSFSLVVIILLITFQGCKKGEDDPFLSLRSRKARITGEWILTSKEYAVYQYDGATTHTEHKSYTNGTEVGVMTYSSGGTTNEYTSSTNYTTSYKFEKDGTYEMKFHSDAIDFTAKGNWTFLKKNKENELKNKEAIILTITSIIYSSGTSYSETITGNVYQIIQLKNKEIILSTEYSGSNPTEIDGVNSTYNESTKMVLTKN